MGRRKSADTIDAKRRRMPYVAKIKREDPFSTADTQETHHMCRRIAAASEYCSLAGWREDAGFKILHFATWAKARAMQHWIDRSGIAHRRVPKLGLSKEEKAAKERELMEWALGSSAAREIVQAYRRCIWAGGAHVSALLEAYQVAAEVGCQRGGLNDAVEYIIEWAQRNHAEWFYRCRPVEETPAKTAAKPVPARAVTPPVSVPAVDPPWQPAF